MKTRRLIIIYMASSAIAWVAVVILMATQNMTLRIIAGFIGMVYLVGSMIMWITVTQSVQFRKWSMTGDQMLEEMRKATEAWDKATRLADILGRQEAVRLWREDKEKRKEVHDGETT